MVPYLYFLLPTALAGWFFPEQLRLSWTENENEMRVVWVTYWDVGTVVEVKAVGCDVSDSRSVAGDSQKANVGDELDRFEYIHEVTLTGVLPQCSYEYRAGNGWLWSDYHTFRGRTPDYSPPYTDASEPSSVVIFGDWGVGPFGWETLHMLEQQAKANPYDAILHIGDIAYNLEWLDGLVGDMFMRMVEPLASQVPYMVGAGNHEGFKNFSQYVDRFAMPVTPENGGNNMFYSLNLGPVHYIMISTEYYYTSNIPGSLSAQLEWLQADLAEANSQRDVRPWVVLGTHHPIYCSVDWRKPMAKPGTLGDNSDCGSDAYSLRQRIEDIYYGGKVDMVVQGHVHNYERDAPIYQNLTVPSEYDDLHMHVNPAAPIYIVSGNAGRTELHNEPVSTTPQDWARWTSNDYGVGRITANQTHLLWEQFHSLSGSRIDYVWVVRPN